MDFEEANTTLRKTSDSMKAWLVRAGVEVPTTWDELFSTFSIEIPDKMPGIYIIKENSKGLIKIGHSSNVNRRYHDIKFALPQSVIVVAIIEIKDLQERKKVERELHETYSPFNHKGEWFRLKDSHVEEIAKKYSGRYRIIHG